MIPLHLSVYLDAFRAPVRTASRSYLSDGLKDYLQVCRWERLIGRLRLLRTDDYSGAESAEPIPWAWFGPNGRSFRCLGYLVPAEDIFVDWAMPVAEIEASIDSLNQ
jgi:hypothetical protein